MSVEFVNQKSSFVEISSDDVNVENIDMNNDFVSLSISEEMGKLITGSFVLWDQNHIYSRILRPGAHIKVKWGYKDDYETGETGFSKGSEVREVEGFVTSPSGGGDNSGNITYSVNFQSTNYRGTQREKWYRSGKYKDVIQEVMLNIGVEVFDIDFERGDEEITANTEVLQYEPDFEFLTRLAWEWRSSFSIGNSRTGQIVGYFLDTERVKSSNIIDMMTESKSNKFEYLTEEANVLSYTWKDNSFNSATGSNVQIRYINGEPVLYRYNTETQKVSAYRLVPERIEEEMSRRGEEQGSSGQAALIAEWMKVNDFDQIERFFEPIEGSTVPDGVGLEMAIQTLGSVRYVVGSTAEFGFGFPDRFGSDDLVFYLKGVSHTVDRSGYKCACQIVDVYTISPTGQIV